jgi:hypothetical protein
MPTSNGRSEDAIRREIEVERRELAHAVEELREGLDDVTDLRRQVGAKLGVAAAAALAGGFVLAGGVGATMRLVGRRGGERSEGRELLRLGRLKLVDRG